MITVDTEPVFKRHSLVFSGSNLLLSVPITACFRKFLECEQATCRKFWSNGCQSVCNYSCSMGCSDNTQDNTQHRKYVQVNEKDF